MKKLIVIILLCSSCLTTEVKQPRLIADKIYDCMIVLIDKGINAEAAQRACAKTFEVK